MTHTNASAAAGGLEYPPDHWSRRDPTASALEHYMQGSERPYNRVKTMHIERLLGDAIRGARVLDYGGGGGYMAVRCAERGARAVTLLDPAPQALALARMLAERHGVQDRLVTRVGAGTQGLAPRSFDVVLLKDVIEHIPGDGRLLRNLAALQPAGGRLVLSTQNQWSLNYLLEGTYRRWWCGERDWCGWDPTHLRFYTPRSMARLLREAGYRPVAWAGVFVVPYTILSWLTLLRVRVELPALAHVDLAIGRHFPFNRLGWNFVVLAERVASASPP